MSQRIENIRHFIAMPRAVRIGIVFRFGNVVEPIAPTRLVQPLLRLHHHVAERGKRHVAAHLTPQLLIALHAGIEQFDSQSQAALAA